ncbi:hypothetical protein V5O48_004314 [Marasmius crinis-equi]|uniref:Uncharacterized protein n=1 Tax=Marasmius crinis-equi TaxID=585013 RepID=A0ABR3FQE1_9AGAR
MLLGRSYNSNPVSLQARRIEQRAPSSTRLDRLARFQCQNERRATDNPAAKEDRDESDSSQKRVETEQEPVMQEWLSHSGPPPPPAPAAVKELSSSTTGPTTSLPNKPVDRASKHAASTRLKTSSKKQRGKRAIERGLGDSKGGAEQ